jgi:hypothetical protein
MNWTVHGSAEERVERLAPGVPKEQHGPPAFAHKRQRPRRRPHGVRLTWRSRMIPMPGPGERGALRQQRRAGPLRRDCLGWRGALIDEPSAGRRRSYPRWRRHAARAAAVGFYYAK